MNNDPETGHARIYWQCRRGMRELDLLLQGFFKTGYRELPPRETAAFSALLEYPDSVLLEWLMGRVVPTDTDVANLVEKIRNTPLP